MSDIGFDNKRHEHPRPGLVSRVYRRLNSHRAGEIFSFCAAVIVSLVEVFRSFAEKLFLQTVVSGFITVLAFSTLSILCILQYRHLSSLLKKYGRLFEEHQKIHRAYEDAIHALRKAKRAEEDVANLFADLGTAEAVFETKMLSTISPDNGRFDSQLSNAG